MYYKKLIGKNIYLAPKTIEDAEKYAEWLNDFSTTDYLGKSGKIMTLEKEKEYLANHMDDEATLDIVTLNEDKLIGTVGLEHIDHLNRRGTLGIFIGDVEEREKGYGTEAINLILDWRKSEFVDGKYYDRLSMDILKEEFTGRYILNRNI